MSLKAPLLSMIAALPAAQPGLAAGEKDDKEKPALPPAIYDSEVKPVAPMSPGLPDMDLRRWPTDRFRDAHATAVIHLSEANGPEKTPVMFGIAELYAGQMLLAEARTILDTLDAPDPLHTRQLSSLRDAVSLLSGEPVIGDSHLFQNDRPDASYWQSLQAIARGDVALLYAHLAGGFAGMTYQPTPVLRATLPVFVEAAIETRQTQLADAALAVLSDIPGIRQEPIGQYLTGRAAQLQDNNATALEAYFQAVTGYDRYAARARLAVAEMALEDGTRGALLAARDIVSDGIEAWRGDSLELSILHRLGEIHDLLGEPEYALKVYGDALNRFPFSDEAAEIREVVEVQLANLYVSGSEGDLSISRWVRAHLLLLPYFRDVPSFAAHTERLADRALGMGATDLAVTEYNRALDLVASSRAGGDLERATQHADILKLKLAHAHARSGQLTLARSVLEESTVPENPILRNEFFLLKAHVLSGMGDTDGLLKTYVEKPDVGYLRNTSRAMIGKNMWQEAIVGLSRLRSEFPQDFDVTDATYLLIAAHNTENEELQADIVRAFPGLTESEAWAGFAERLGQDMQASRRLNLNSAIERLDYLSETLENAEFVNFDPEEKN